MRRLALLLLLASACGTGSAAGIPEHEDVVEMISDIALEPRTFRYTVETPVGAADLSGIVEDDQRFSTELFLEGSPALSEVVIDDARYLKPTSELNGLPAGVWSVDPDGAMGWLETAPRPSPFDPRRTLARIRVAEYLVTDIASGTSFREWNTDAADYLPAEDKFDPHPDAGVRLDMRPVRWNPTVIAVGIDAVRKYFTWISVWVKDSKVTRIERLLELPDPADAAWDDMYSNLTRASAVVDATGLIPPINAKSLPGMSIHEVFTYSYGNVTVEAPEQSSEVRWTSSDEV